MTIFDSPYLRIRYDEALRAVVEEWQLDFTVLAEGQAFRQPLEQLLAAIPQAPGRRWLCDNTEQKNISPSDQIWLEDVYYPGLVKAGVQACALVNNKNILLTSVAKNQLQHLTERQITVEIFNKRQAAEEWLKSF